MEMLKATPLRSKRTAPDILAILCTVNGMDTVVGDVRMARCTTASFRYVIVFDAGVPVLCRRQSVTVCVPYSDA